ncbi:MAG: hypothetical protein ACYC0V_16650 [Armatimonadota bacterium]
MKPGFGRRSTEATALWTMFRETLFPKPIIHASATSANTCSIQKPIFGSRTTEATMYYSRRIASRASNISKPAGYARQAKYIAFMDITGLCQRAHY